MLVRFSDALRKNFTHAQAFEGEVGIFIDWTALPQKVSGHERSLDERVAFGHALGCMQVWFAHMLTTVFLMTGSIEGCAPFEQRGWPSFERLVSMICKPNSENTWPMIVDTGRLDAAAKTMPQSGFCERVPPQTIEQFSASLRTKRFTDGCDCEVVIELYRNTISAVLGFVPLLDMFGNPTWGDGAMRTVVEILPLCRQVTQVNFVDSFYELTDAGLNSLANAVLAGQLPPNLSAIIWFGLNADVKNGSKAAKIRLREAIRAREGLVLVDSEASENEYKKMVTCQTDLTL